MGIWEKLLTTYFILIFFASVANPYQFCMDTDLKLLTDTDTDSYGCGSISVSCIDIDTDLPDFI